MGWCNNKLWEEVNLLIRSGFHSDNELLAVKEAYFRFQGNTARRLTNLDIALADVQNSNCKKCVELEKKIDELSHQFKCFREVIQPTVLWEECGHHRPSLDNYSKAYRSKETWLEGAQRAGFESCHDCGVLTKKFMESTSEKKIQFICYRCLCRK